MKNIKKQILLLCAATALQQGAFAQRLHLFSEEIKTDYPSVVYDFLERYLYEADSLVRKGVDIRLKLHDDKVIFTKGDVSAVRSLTPSTAFSLNKVDNKYYQVSWTNAKGNTLLSLAFPMQYELLWGKTKAELEKTLKEEILAAKNFQPIPMATEENTTKADDGCLMTQPTENYYVSSLNTSTYYNKGAKGLQPVFNADDKWHSAANLFLGCMEQSDQYTLYVEQNVYGFKKQSFTVKLDQWLAYCQAMKLKLFFTIEEEREDGLKALLIAQSDDLKFNHMLSVILPNDFVSNPKAVLKATLNAYIPTQNVKSLYQQYVKRKKKQI